MTKIGVLTSTRAEYSIYSPLLNKIREATDWSLDILAYGTHLSEQYGYTAREIEKDGFRMAHAINTMPTDDSPGAVVRSMALTMNAFSSIWEREDYDLVLAHGDRFEMFAAVASTAPFNLKVAHIAGGETTLGAIDNSFRHSITHMSCIHFTTTEAYRLRVIELLGHDHDVHFTGSLSVDNLCRPHWIGRDDFKARWGVDLEEPFMLITVHPETIAYGKNLDYIREVVAALRTIKDFKFVVTMPNADTMGWQIRQEWHAFAKECPAVQLVESFGTAGYITAMKHCALMLGNTSSGFAEAEFFPKPVVNLGERQRGRIITPNIINCPFNAQEIVAAVRRAASLGNLKASGIYGNGTAAEAMMKHISAHLGVPLRSA